MAEGFFTRLKKMIFGEAEELGRQGAELTRDVRDQAAKAATELRNRATEAAGEARKSAEHAAGELRETAGHVAEEAREAATEAIDKAQAAAAQAIDAGRKAVDAAMASAGEAVDAARETATGAVEAMRRHAGPAAEQAVRTAATTVASTLGGAASSPDGAGSGATDEALDHGRFSMAHVEMVVNGRKVSGNVEGRTLLVHFLRENLNLTGTHVGCDTSQCGACVVHVDGKAVKSCTMLAAQASGSTVTTLEGLAVNGELHPVQAAFREHHGLQCGFCTPGMIMTAVDMINRHGGGLDEKTVRAELEGNICRCTGYHNIVKAILDAASKMGAGARIAAE